MVDDNKDYSLWLSDRDKRSNDFQLAKDLMKYIDMTNPITAERCKKIDENFQLHSGRWDAIRNLNPVMSIDLGNENIMLGSGKLYHYPIIDRVSKSIVSDLITRPLIPIIRDNSSKARTHRDRIRLERVKEFFYNTVIQPEYERITQEYDMQNGVYDPIKLSAEEQQQRGADIENRVKQATPEEIQLYLKRLSTPDELVAEALLKEGLRYVKAKYKFDIGAENAVVTAEDYYRLDIINGMPYMETYNPKWVTWRGSERSEFCEDGQYAKHTQYLTPEDAITRYASSLTKKTIKELEAMYSHIPGVVMHGGNANEIERKQIVDLIADNPSIQDGLNIKTLEGQDRLKHLYTTLTHSYKAGYGIKESFITWRWMRRVKFVERVVNGKKEMFIRDEHYEKDPFAGDIKVSEKLLPQTWSGTILGDDVFVDIKPRPYQYNNINDPFDVKLAIYGGRYNTYQNTVDNSSPIDLGKPWQFRYNVLMKKMEDHQATDIGKVFLGTTTMKPTGWTWSQWYKSLFVAKTAMVSNHREGINNLDASFFRSIDLSRTVDIENDIRQLEYLENKIITSMYYSPQKIGEISQYATNRNTTAAIQGVDRQMYRFQNRNRLIKENVLNDFLKLCIFAYKDNEEVKSTIMDDFLKAHYEINFNQTDTSNFSLTVVDDFQESQKLDQMRQLALTFLQNGMTAGQLSALFDTESLSELRQLLEDMDIKKEEQSEQAYQREQATIDKQRQAAEAQLQLQQQFIQAEAERDRQVKIRLAEINSLMLQNANDVDRDHVNDSLQKALLDIQSREKMEGLKMEHESKMMDKKAEMAKK